MRHRKRLAKLGKPADQRKALLRSLATQLFLHGEIVTTVTRAKALISFASPIITYAKAPSSLQHAARMISKRIYSVKTEETFESKNGKAMPVTVLRKILRDIGPRYVDRPGGYIRVLKVGQRRQGDAARMALVQLVEG
jgi:large subunit ribosomal protein L17